MSPSAEDSIDDPIRRQLGPLYEELAAAEWDQHRALLDEINKPDDFRLSWKRQGPDSKKLAA